METPVFDFTAEAGSVEIVQTVAAASNIWYQSVPG
jgi:hypothetical protein